MAPLVPFLRVEAERAEFIPDGHEMSALVNQIVVLADNKYCLGRAGLDRPVRRAWRGGAQARHLLGLEATRCDRLTWTTSLRCCSRPGSTFTCKPTAIGGRSASGHGTDGTPPSDGLRRDGARARALPRVRVSTRSSALASGAGAAHRAVTCAWPCHRPNEWIRKR